jgi:hypothetical protein
MRRFVLGWKMLGLEQSLGSRIVTYADDLVILCQRGKAEEALVSTPIIGVQRVKRIAYVNDSICIRLVPQNHASAELELGTSVSSAPSRQLPYPNGPIVNQFTIAVEVIELILARHDRS